MHFKRWIGFGLSAGGTTTLVHFLPAARIVSAPYPCVCKLSIFGNAGGRSVNKQIVLEGARLKQPDGIRIQDVFSEVLELRGLYGISVELTTLQPRIDLDASLCIIEILAGGNSVRYRPQLVSGRSESAAQALGIKSPVAVHKQSIAPSGEKRNEEIRPALVLQGQSICSSVIVVNGTDDTLHPVPLSNDRIEPFCVREITPNAQYQEFDCPLGPVAAGIGQVAIDSSSNAAGYLLVRDRATNVPVSVCTL